MITDEITHILYHLLPNSRAFFLGVFASDILPPMNSIQSLVPCCFFKPLYNWAGLVQISRLLHSRPNHLEFFDRYFTQACEFGISFPKSLQIFHTPHQILACGTLIFRRFCSFILSHRGHNYSVHSLSEKF